MGRRIIACLALLLAGSGACGTLTPTDDSDAGSDDAGDADAGGEDGGGDASSPRYCEQHRDVFMCVDFDDEAGASNAWGPLDGGTAFLSKDQSHSPPASLLSLTPPASAPRGNGIAYFVVDGAPGHPSEIDVRLAIQVDRAASDGLTQFFAVRIADATQFELGVKNGTAQIKQVEHVRDASSAFRAQPFSADASVQLLAGGWHDVHLHVSYNDKKFSASVDGEEIADPDGVFVPPATGGVVLFLGLTYDASTTGWRIHIDDVLFDPK